MKSLQQYIESIRQKPEHIRLRYTMAFVFGIMILVIFVWLLSIQQNFSNMTRPSVLDDAGKGVQGWGQDVENSLKLLESSYEEQMIPLEEEMK